MSVNSHTKFHDSHLVFSINLSDDSSNCESCLVKPLVSGTAAGHVSQPPILRGRKEKQWNAASMVNPANGIQLTTRLQMHESSEVPFEVRPKGVALIPWKPARRSIPRWSWPSRHILTLTEKTMHFCSNAKCHVRLYRSCAMWKYNESTRSSVERMSQSGHRISQLFPTCSRSIYHLRQPQCRTHHETSLGYSSKTEAAAPHQTPATHVLKAAGGLQDGWPDSAISWETDRCALIRQHITNLKAEGMLKNQRKTRRVEALINLLPPPPPHAATPTTTSATTIDPPVGLRICPQLGAGKFKCLDSGKDVDAVHAKCTWPWTMQRQRRWQLHDLRAAPALWKQNKATCISLSSVDRWHSFRAGLYTYSIVPQWSCVKHTKSLQEDAHYCSYQVNI